MPVSKKRKKKKEVKNAVHHPTTIEPSAPPSSPRWYIIAMTVAMSVGLVLILSRYIFQLNQVYLFTGLILLAVGFIMTTNFR